MFITSTKKYFIPFLSAFLVLLAVSAILGFAGLVKEKGTSVNSNTVDNEKCYIAYSKANLFKEAIDEFGATSPEMAARLWAKGVQQRNGALQYAVMDKELKIKYAEKMEKERPSWVTGVSSPWVDKFEIVKTEKKNNTTYSFLVRFYMMTSTGSAGSHDANLLISKSGNYWAIKSAVMDEFLKGLTGFP